MRLLLHASAEKTDFYNLLRTEITFSGDIITIGGQITHTKGEKAYITLMIEIFTFTT